MNDRVAHPKDEIELIEILRVMWKWKYLILVGTAAFALVAGVISSNKPKVYRINMVLKPGVVKIDRFGRRIHVDSASNMKALLEAGTFTNEIRDYVKTLKEKDKPGPLQFRVTALKQSNIIKISYETQRVDTGIQILTHIPELLRKKYAEEIRHFEKEYDDKIQNKTEELADAESKKKITESIITVFENRSKELTLAIQDIENNNRRLVVEKERYNKNSNENSVNIYLLYSSEIQKNLQLMNEYKSQLSELLSTKEEDKLQLKRTEERIRFLSMEIAELNKEKNSIQYIEVLQPPTSSRSPIKPKTKVAVMIAFVVGLFVTVFSSFFLEYLLDHRRRKTSTENK
jgi:capsular polysaccharide biosynthesis protein